MNRDFVEMLAALSEARADFLVIGAHAVGGPRNAADIADLESTGRSGERDPA